MKIKEYDYNWCPEGMDFLCIELCRVLNQLPGIETYESCMGHGKHPYWIFFRCTELGTLSRLGRCLAKNYSDNNWELVVDSVDGDPYGCFWLRTKEILDEDFSFLLISSYTTGISHISLSNILKKEFIGCKIETGENTLPITEDNLILPCGIYGKVTKN